MKVACFGNTNNSPLIIAQAIRSMGHDVLLIVNRKEVLHRPESRYPEYQGNYPDWIMDASDYSEWDYVSLNPCVEPVLKALAAYDALILNDLGPSLLPLLNRTAVSILTGSDLDYFASHTTVEALFAHSDEAYRKSREAVFTKLSWANFIQRQREGIRLSAGVHYFPPGIVPAGDAILSEIGVASSTRFFQFIGELESITASPQPNNSPIRIFCPVRITWKLPIEPGRSTLDYKGSDIMIRGLGLFYRKTGTRLSIHLVRKGLHIGDLERLIEEEGIEDQIVWMDEMSLVAVWEEMARSDIVLEQFGNSTIAKVGMDALASGRPVIGNMRPEIFGDSMPICQARTPEEICEQLERLVFDPKERERIGKAGREYVEKHANINEFAQKCLRYLGVSFPNKVKAESLLQGDISYYLQERHLLLEEKVTQECLDQQNPEHKAHLTTSLLSSKRTLQRLILKEPFRWEGGLSWSIQLENLKYIADNTESPYRSTVLLYEDDRLLQPAHAVQENIYNWGGGRYLHWNERLFFSTLDGSDPNSNGRVYRIVYCFPPIVAIQEFFARVISRLHGFFNRFLLKISLRSDF